MNEQEYNAHVEGITDELFAMFEEYFEEEDFAPFKQACREAVANSYRHGISRKEWLLAARRLV